MPKSRNANRQTRPEDAEIAALEARKKELARELAELVKQRQTQRDELEREASSQRDALEREASSQREALVTELARTKRVRQAELEAEVQQHADELVRRAEQRAETLLREAAATAEQRQQDAESDAQRILADTRKQTSEAREEAHQVRLEAQSTREELLADAHAKADEIRQQAYREAEGLRLQAASVHQSAEAKRQQLLTEREQELAELRAKLADAERRERELAEREDDLDQQEHGLRELRQSLREREAQLSPERVADLEQELQLAHHRQRAASDKLTAMAQQRDELDAALQTAGGPHAADRLHQLEELRKRAGELETKLAQAPDPYELQRLTQQLERAQHQLAQHEQDTARLHELEQAQIDHDHAVADLRTEQQRLARERDALRRDHSAVQQELNELRALLDQSEQVEIERDRLANQNTYLRVELERLQRDNDEKRNTREQTMQRHYGRLAELDDSDHVKQLVASDFGCTLEPAGKALAAEQLAKKLQSMMHHDRTGGGSGRQYHLHDIQAFLGCVASSRMVLLKGRSGTGKTSLPQFAARAMGFPCAIVPVQSGWRDRLDLLGGFNAFTKEFRSTAFTEALYIASTPNFRDRPFFIVLDECNLSRVEYYLADLLSELQLEGKEHRLRLLERKPGDTFPKQLKDGIELRVPDNVWFFLTANEDESTFEIADKTLDRSLIMQMDDVAPSFDKLSKLDLQPVSLKSLRSALTPSSTGLSKHAEDLLKTLRDKLLERFQIGFGNRFTKQAPTFVSAFTLAGGTEEDAVDRLVSTKLLAKLKRLHDPRQRDGVQALLDVVTGSKLKLVRSELLLEATLERLGGRL